MVSKKTDRGQCVAGRNTKNVKLVKEKIMKTNEKKQVIDVNKTKIKGAKKMKYKVKLFYPEILTDYETGLEVEHHEIGWSWSNGPPYNMTNVSCQSATLPATKISRYTVIPH